VKVRDLREWVSHNKANLNKNDLMIIYNEIKEEVIKRTMTTKEKFREMIPSISTILIL
jgi:hypothetical protein